MADLVGDHIGLRELAGRAEAACQLVEEAEIEIDALIGRAIEGTHRCLADAALGPRGVAEQHELGLAILPAHLAEDITPYVFGALEHARDELRFGICRGRRGRRSALRRRRTRRRGRGRRIARAAATGNVVQDRAGVGAHYHGNDDEGHQAEAALEQAAAAAHAVVAAAIFDVAALVAIHLHGRSPSPRS